MQYVVELDMHGEIKYAEVWSNLKEVSPEELTAKAGTWRRKCYQEATHSGMLKRSRERYEKEVAIESGKKKKQEGYDVSSNQLTRSQIKLLLITKLCVFFVKKAPAIEKHSVWSEPNRRANLSMTPLKFEAMKSYVRSCLLPST